MKHYPTLLQRCWLAAVLLLATAWPSLAKNTKTTVAQVTETVTVSAEEDYVVTSATPFADGGVVNITNTDHAVLILEAVKPSAALSLLPTHVQIRGARAVNGQNCQVKLYNLGCIIMPYASDLKPLTVYSEPDFGGDRCDDFGLEHSGGYMNTLTDAKLNNRIRSFKLKRGYMVTFALRAGGRGYSRCFVAADEDLEVASLPGVLDQSISSYRVFKWYDTGKKQLANSAGDTGALAALNVQSTYDWGQGNSSLLPDIEWVPNHIYEDWPSSSTIGSTTQSPHTKNNNEPRNSADDHPQDLETILNNWENMMRTGMRLCSPASWDGSDYWNATGFLAEFLDSIDSRGWRCDIIDLHCYWPENNFGNIANWVNKYHRPVWISEWCWGASWNSNGAFASGVTETQVKEALERICTRLNGFDYVERYYYWNGERDPSRLYKNGTLTAAGKYYAAMNSGLGYNGKYDYAPRIPTQRDPSDLVVSYDKETSHATLTWHDYNGEMNASISVQRRPSASGTWQTIADIAMKEQAADYTYVDTEATNGCQYRVMVVDANNETRYTKTAMAASTDLQAGDAVSVDGVTKYLGGNVLPNGSFDMGTYGWTNGVGEPIGAPWFQVLPEGGSDGGSYLQAYGNGTRNTAQALKTVFDVEAQADYYFSGAICNYGGSSCLLNLSEDGQTSVSGLSGLPSLRNSTQNWLTQFKVFNTGEYTKAIVWFRSLEAKAQVDQLMLCRLFDTQEEAVADGVAKARVRAEAFTAYNTANPQLTADLRQTLDALPTTATLEQLRQLETAIDQAILAYDNTARLNTLIDQASHLTTLHLYGEATLQQAIDAARQAQTVADVNNRTDLLEQAIDAYLPLTTVSGKITNPNFATKATDDTDAPGWTTKCGTYTAGDQRQNSNGGVTFWNAWWSGLSASEGTARTMEIRQEVKGLDHGLYALQCNASTEHYCLSDQHGFITDGTVTEATAQLTADYYDLPSMSREQRWQTLLSAPVYVPQGGSVTVGFTGSKQGATDGQWVEYANTATNKTGDQREGWWCATGFTLRFHPLYRRTVTPQELSVACLPYALHPSPGLRFYQIAGMLADFSALCLEEVDEVEAGVPFMFTADTDVATFLEYGKTGSRKTGAGGLMGVYNADTRVPKGYYHYIGGQWVKVETAGQYRTTEYTAVLRAFTDQYSKAIPLYASWDGLTVPIQGVTDEEREVFAPSAIAAVAVRPVAVADGLYTIDGRRLPTTTPAGKGIYVSVEGGTARKVVKQ